MLARPALKQLYEIAGRRVLVAAQDEWCANAVPAFFDGWFLKRLPLQGPTTFGKLAQTALINIGLAEIPRPASDKFAKFEIAFGGIGYADGQSFHFDFDGSSVIFGPPELHQVDIWINQTYDPNSKIFTQIISQAFSAVLRRSGLFEFPSAGVMPPGEDRAVLIAGESGTGKSTLTLQLAANGWRYLSDDTLLLEQNQRGLEAHALRRFFAVTPETMHAVQLPELKRQAKLSSKTRVMPQDLFPFGQIQSATPGAIFFSKLGKDSQTTILKLPAAEAMTRLLRLCPWAAYDKPTAGEHLGLLGQLAKECKAFELVAGRDILQDQSLAPRLMDQVLKT